MTAELGKLLVREGKDGENLPLTGEIIRRAFSWLVREVSLPRELVSQPSFAVRAYTHSKRGDQPEPLLLNSFFLDDLAQARELDRVGKLTPALRRYLGELKPEARADLLRDPEVLGEAVAPRMFPAARWPAPGRHPLVLLQQAAVNLFSAAERSNEILGVNGPPGTGKTTLLRDIVADLVARRAERMLDLAKAADAFTNSGQRLRAGNSWIHLYRLAPALRGFEVLVASSNNKAVENVSAELPGKEAIADDIDLSYFRSLSDQMLERETWGAIAAVLGNAKNRYRFKDSFWWNEEHALRRYLLQAAGSQQYIETPAEEGGVAKRRRPKILEDIMPPATEWEAQRRWREAKERFRNALARSRSLLDELETVRAYLRTLPLLIEAARQRSRLWQARPAFWSRLFRTHRFRRWAKNYRTNADQLTALIDDSRLPDPIGANMRSRIAAHLEPRLESVLEKVEALFAAAKRRELDLGARVIGEAFFRADHEVRQKVAPWLPDEVQRARDDVFVAAMDLHRAFIDGAAKPLRHNLGALMDMFGGPAPASPDTAKLLPDLWSSLFLVVPVVSTTFASVQRMLGALSPESLGCLIIDEAGQATPQAAVGAMLRCKRALVVGDPIQVPPVVTLPASLTATLCRRFGIDPVQFNAPDASTQTIADTASAFCAEFEGDLGSRTVGAPLLVHRRCSEPMFSIANAVAYSGLMVQAKSPGPSAIRNALGPAMWLDVRGPAQDKWCPAEGEVVLGLLRGLAAAGADPDLFIVTPFVAVQDGLRSAIEKDESLAGWIGDRRPWAFDRVGTIHTVQGREAEAVIFVLGAPRPDQRGARIWAGKQPNLLNVAVTRAKEVLYVVGAREAWKDVGVFSKLAAYLPTQAAAGF